MILVPGGGSLSGVAGIVSGYDTSCAFLGGGTLSCWGGAAPFGLPGSELYATPQSLLNGASALSIANYHLCWQHGASLACATTNPTEAPSFGDALDASADAAGTDAAIVVGVSPPAASPAPFAQLVSSPYFTCVLDGAGAVYCLGDNDSNESDPDPASPSGVQTAFTPAPIPNGLPVLQLALTEQAACARQQAHVVCWGSGYMAANGGTDKKMNEVVYADGGALTDPVSITAGELHSCALLGSTQVACWGDNANHQLGRGEPVTQAGGTSTSAQVVRLADGGAFARRQRSSSRGGTTRARRAATGRSGAGATTPTGRRPLRTDGPPQPPSPVSFDRSRSSNIDLRRGGSKPAVSRGRQPHQAKINHRA